MQVPDCLNQTNHISKVLEEVVGGKVEASSHHFCCSKKIPSNERNPKSCSAAAGAQRNLDLELVRFFNALAPEAGTSNWFKGNFMVHSRPSHGKMNESIPHFGLMRWEHIAKIWKKGLLNNHFSIFFFDLGQSFPVSNTDWSIVYMDS